MINAKWDACGAYQLGFQKSASPVMEGIVNFHNYVMIFIVFIVVGVVFMLFSILREYSKNVKVVSHKYLVHGTTIEIIWTITPAIILVFIAFPSFKLIYLIDEVVEPTITIKVIGHQWYWSYEYGDYVSADGSQAINFDSYMIPTNELEEGQFRLLEVDEKVIVPVNTPVRVIITSADVIHSWAVPSLGIKLDAVPGRLNQVGFLASREGVFYGQCSEICGANHAFMPIVVEATSLENYCDFITERLNS
jgi:cytochrome c oxidase subunit 2